VCTFLQKYAEIVFLHKSAERCTPFCRNCISAEILNFCINLQKGVPLPVDFCRNLKFLQKYNFCRKGHTFCRFLQKSKISEEICRNVCTFLQKLYFCRNLKFLQKGVPLPAEIVFLQISAEMCAPFCRNLKFLHKFKISAERCTSLQISEENLRFLQKFAEI
jgi:hypothetical protein